MPSICSFCYCAARRLYTALASSLLTESISALNFEAGFLFSVNAEIHSKSMLLIDFENQSSFSPFGGCLALNFSLIPDPKLPQSTPKQPHLTPRWPRPTIALPHPTIGRGSWMVGRGSHTICSCSLPFAIVFSLFWWLSCHDLSSLSLEHHCRHPRVLAKLHCGIVHAPQRTAVSTTHVCPIPNSHIHT